MSRAGPSTGLCSLGAKRQHAKRATGHAEPGAGQEAWCQVWPAGDSWPAHLLLILRRRPGGDDWRAGLPSRFCCRRRRQGLNSLGAGIYVQEEQRLGARAAACGAGGGGTQVGLCRTFAPGLLRMHRPAVAATKTRTGGPGQAGARTESLSPFSLCKVAVGAASVLPHCPIVDAALKGLDKDPTRLPQHTDGAGPTASVLERPVCFRGSRFQEDASRESRPHSNATLWMPPQWRASASGSAQAPRRAKAA